ncbi:hypothetical protein Hdeb2414_s0010g00333791 [Helianthus debilis subsp. tardiflorus]
MCITWYKRGMKLRGVEGVSPEAIRRPDYRLWRRSVVERERERVREGKELRFVCVMFDLVAKF